MNDLEGLCYEPKVVAVKKSTLHALTDLNMARCQEFEAGSEGFGLGDFGCALAGEAGELCNVLKKIRRVELGVVMRQPGMTILREKAREELADTFLYLDLIATKLGIDLMEAVVEKFNRTSEENDAPHRLELVE